MRRTSGKQDSGPHPAQNVSRRTKRRIIGLNAAPEISRDLNFGAGSLQSEGAGGTRTKKKS
jgi:hypothetical protein